MEATDSESPPIVAAMSAVSCADLVTRARLIARGTIFCGLLGKYWRGAHRLPDAASARDPHESPQWTAQWWALRRTGGGSQLLWMPLTLSSTPRRPIGLLMLLRRRRLRRQPRKQPFVRHESG